VLVTVFISVTYCFWYTVFVPHEAAQPPHSPPLTTAPLSTTPSLPLPQAQSAAHVLVHVATTAKAVRRPERTLRTTQTSRKKETNRGKSSRFFARARTSVGRRDLSLPTTERFGRLIIWIDYVD